MFQQWRQRRERQAPSGRPCTAVTPRNEERLDQQIRANRRITTVYGAEYRLQCIQNDSGNVGILQSLCQVGPTNAHTRT